MLNSGDLNLLTLVEDFGIVVNVELLSSDEEAKECKALPVLYRLVSFMTGFIIAVGATFLLPAQTHFYHQCPRFEGINPSEKFYTLEEGKRLLDHRVRYAHASQHPQNTGRVASLDMIISDKFFVVVDWDIAPDNGKPGLRWYSRDAYERDLIEE